MSDGAWLILAACGVAALGALLGSVAYLSERAHVWVERQAPLVEHAIEGGATALGIALALFLALYVWELAK
jgi:hypothetical protein